MEIKEPIIGINGNISIEIINITVNKKYNCAKMGYTDCQYNLCPEKKHFMLNPTTKEALCATEIELVVTNISNKKSVYCDFNKFQIVDTEGFTYNWEEQLCGILQNGKHNYFDCTIHPNSQIRAIICFPELKENIAIHKIYFTTNENQRIVLDIAPLSERAQRKLELLKKRSEVEKNQREQTESIAEVKHQFDRLKNALDKLQWLTFQRLNNALTKSEKIRLENQIMNGEFEIKTQLQKLTDTDKQEIENLLNDIMSDYRKRLVPANGNSTEVWERISNEGAREDLGETIFRSSWEANIARILNSKGIHWEYETTPFMLDTTPYLPDFFLDDGTIMEVKGHWDNESIAKVEAFMRSNPETNYLIVDHDMYPDLTQLYGDKIPNWEKVQANKEKVNVVVVGLSFVPDKSVIKNLQVGETLQMELEPNNQYDKFAIAIKTATGGMVGHIEKKFAPIYAQKLKLGMTFSLDVVSVEPKIIRAKAYRNNWEKPIIHSIFSNSEA